MLWEDSLIFKGSSYLHRGRFLVCYTKTLFLILFQKSDRTKLVTAWGGRRMRPQGVSAATGAAKRSAASTDTLAFRGFVEIPVENLAKVTGIL